MDSGIFCPDMIAPRPIFLILTCFVLSMANTHAQKPVLVSIEDESCPDYWDNLDWNQDLSQNLAPAFLKPNEPRFRILRPHALPLAPKRPPPLFLKPKFNPIGCHREYDFRAKRYFFDSHDRRDGEGLRPRLKLIPEAQRELDLYQETRARIEPNAYIGTIGVAMILVSLLASSQVKGPSAATVRTIGMLAGGSVVGGAFAYSFYQLRESEEHLRSAVRMQNAAAPNEPVTLGVSTGFFF